MSDSANNEFNYQTRNYPSEHDTTSQGGYNAPNTFSPANQRHADPFTNPKVPPNADTNFSNAAQFEPSNTGLIDQSLDGGELGGELQDARQGADERARDQFAYEARRDFDRQRPGVGNPDKKEEMGGQLASAYADQRGRQYESGGVGGGDAGAGTF